MSSKKPLVGEYFLHADKIYKVLLSSRGTDEILLEDISDGARYSVRFSVFKYAYKRVWKVGDVAKMLERSPRSIYRYELRGQTQEPKRYNAKGGKQLRFYTKQEVLEIHEMISEIAQGRPRKDNRVVNNTLPNRAALLTLMRERYDQ